MTTIVGLTGSSTPHRSAFQALVTRPTGPNICIPPVTKYLVNLGPRNTRSQHVADRYYCTRSSVLVLLFRDWLGAFFVLHAHVAEATQIGGRNGIQPTPGTGCRLSAHQTRAVKSQSVLIAKFLFLFSIISLDPGIQIQFKTGFWAWSGTSMFVRWG